MLVRTALLLAFVAACSAITFQKPAGGENWALLMAGSNTWGNYRHQADIYHSYQILKKGGIPDSNIVVMHYDDIADSPQNPKKGTVINSPTGKDVYAGVPKDYTGSEVTAATFLSVLAGKEPSLETVSNATTTCDRRGKFVCPAASTCCCTKHGLFECHEYTCCKSGTTCDAKAHQCTAPPPPGPSKKKTIASGPNDHVFVYFADHGGPGILGVPSGAGDYIHAKDIVDTIVAKQKAGGFAQMTFYLEACESGSIFDGLLPANINVYATTAANPSESSWGCYCPGMKQPPPSGYNTCLGDLYSVAWLENADASDLKTETLLAQYTEVKQRTSQNGTYSQGSHVMQYGDLSIDKEDAAVFEGESPSEERNEIVPDLMDVAPQRDANLMWLHHAYTTAVGAVKAEALAAYSAELRFRENIDSRMAATVEKLVGKAEAEAVMSEVHTPVVQDWTCFKAAIAAFQESCMPMREYGMRHTRSLANLCDAGVTPAMIAAAAQKVC